MGELRDYLKRLADQTGAPPMAAPTGALYTATLPVLGYAYFEVDMPTTAAGTADLLAASVRWSPTFGQASIADSTASPKAGLVIQAIDVTPLVMDQQSIDGATATGWLPAQVARALRTLHLEHAPNGAASRYIPIPVLQGAPAYIPFATAGEVDAVDPASSVKIVGGAQNGVRLRVIPDGAIIVDMSADQLRLYQARDVSAFGAAGTVPKIGITIYGQLVDYNEIQRRPSLGRVGCTPDDRRQSIADRIAAAAFFDINNKS